MPKILAFAGSTRKESINGKLLKVAVAAAQQAGADITLIDLADYPMPLFDQDLEASEGLPDGARQLKQLMVEADGFLIASPEYNSAFSPLLKNVIDWASRAEAADEPPLAAYRGKVAAIIAASPGALGGLRGLVFLRMLLGNLGVLVIPEQQAVSFGFKAFADDGSLEDERNQAGVTRVVTSLVTMLNSLHG